MEPPSLRLAKTSTGSSIFVLVVSSLLLLLAEVQGQQVNDFAPIVTASCTDYPSMKILVNIGQPFYGVVHADGYRTDACQVFGNGEPNVTLRVNVLAKPNEVDYCGLSEDKDSGAKTLNVFVRYHKTLERLEDKPFHIQCDNPGFFNSRSELSRVSLSFVESGNKKTKEMVKGHQYTLRVEQSKPDPNFGLKVKRCFTFTSSADHQQIDLTDERGCPVDSTTMSRFGYNAVTGTVDAIVFSMFKFPDTSDVRVNCKVEVCKGSCPDTVCDGSSGRSIDDGGIEQFWTGENAYVLEPGQVASLPLQDCTIQRWSWLLGLCIAFGVLFLIMLIVNILLCSALTCSCAKQEVEEREPSVIEDYDPYKGGWSGSQYGSRYSLNGNSTKPSAYGLGGSTPNSTAARSVSTNSDHYAMVHSQPGSRGYVDDRSSKGGFPQSTLSNGRH